VAIKILWFRHISKVGKPGKKRFFVLGNLDDRVPNATYIDAKDAAYFF
jgi:hypothetical protein